jgi:CPA1 family monovalent cation:H+ antiporter
LRPISLLAVWGVLFTAIVVGYIASYLVPNLSLAAAIVLGAAIAPPDAVAATSIANRLGIPRRIVTILEGEGVVNDATALTIYRFATAAVVTGSFSLKQSLLTFALIAVGEIGWGLLVGKFFTWLWPRVKDTSIEVALSLVAPYVSYMPPEQLGGSGVLAAVTAGLFIGERAFSALAFDTRIQTRSVWDMVRFILENILFLLTGLQLRLILAGTGDYSTRELIAYGALVSLAIIVIRFLWVFPATYIPRKLFRRIREKDPAPPWQYPFLISFTGMRGAISLAAAFAIPEVTASGEPFPGRDLIAFLTFCVIVTTLLAQGLTLPLVIRWLGIDKHGAAEREKLKREEMETRLIATEDALRHIDKSKRNHSSDVLTMVRELYKRREETLRERINGRDWEDIEEEVEFRSQLISSERATVADLREKGKVSDDVVRRIESDLDHEEARLLAKLHKHE